MIRADALTFVNATLAGGAIGTLRVQGNRIAALNQPPQPGDRVIDLNGDRLLPGLINAHDHLHLNNFPRLEYRAPYPNAGEWIADVKSRMQTDRVFSASIAISREDRLLQGGIKNLLSGVTTVAHHDPLYPFLSSAHYPTRVVRHYGWSHSLLIEGEEKVQRSYHDTPPDWPWIIHAAEGVDDESAQEFERLEALGCLQTNTLIVHGVALDPAQQAKLRRSGAGLIWCPASNLRLFATTVNVVELAARGCVALGTDSRMTGAHDLLDELRVAAEISGLDDQTLESMVTHDSARLLRLSDRGVLAPGMLADLLVLPRRAALSRATRADVRLVMVDGIVRYADKDCAVLADPGADWVHILVDGRAKLLDRSLAELLRTAEARESGVELPEETWRAA